MKSSNLISIIMPVYNEGKNIAKQLIDLEKVIKVGHEILIIYDFSKDDTVPVVKKLQKDFKKIRLIKNQLGAGVINAVKTGFSKAHGKKLVVMPADLADDPKTILKMSRKIDEGFDVVCATRYSLGGKKEGGGGFKTLLSRTAGLASPLLLGIPTTDISNGFKMYKKEVTEKINIESSGGWEFAMEMVIKAKRLEFEICEVPSTWRDRTAGKSKFKFYKWFPKYLKWYLRGIVWHFT